MFRTESFSKEKYDNLKEVAEFFLDFLIKTQKGQIPSY